jgi:hypothetical protein
MKVLSKRLGAALLAMVIAVWAVPAPVGAQAAYEDATLKAFVTAAIAVEELIVAWTPRIQNAEDEAQALDLQEQAKSEIDSAIEGIDGMSVDSYMGIMQAIDSDLELRQRVQDIYLRRQDQ